MQLVNSAHSLTDHMFKQLGRDNNVHEITGRIQFAESACKLCASMPQGLFKTALLQDISARSEIPITDIEHSITKLSTKQSTNHEPSHMQHQALEQDQGQANIRPDPILEQLIAWTIQYPTSINAQHTILHLKSDNAMLKILKECIRHVDSGRSLSAASLLVLIDNKNIQSGINKHLMKFHLLRDIDEKAHWNALADSWQEKALQQKINKLIAHGKNNELSLEQKRQLNELIALKQKISTYTS
jgi:hypothetical protein